MMKKFWLLPSCVHKLITRETSLFFYTDTDDDDDDDDDDDA